MRCWKETYTRTYSKNYIKLKLNTESENAALSKKLWLCEQQFEEKVGVTKTSNPICYKCFARTVVKDYCHLTSRFRGLAKNECNFETRKARCLLIPLLFHDLFRHDRQLIF